MLDALLPARDALADALAEGTSFPEALRRAAEAGERGMEATIPLVARKGRASYLGERSAGHQDPGATSSYLLLETVADTWAGDGSHP
jgi:dihydroxyacetone kinase-like protein